jgi:RNA polymerase sigma-70 factor, ECF subfamily
VPTPTQVVWRGKARRSPTALRGVNLAKAEHAVSAGAASGPAQGRLPEGDSKLAAAILAGDRKATAEFVSRYTDQVHRYVFARLVPRTDLVEDLVQDVFLSAWEHLASFRGESSLEAWLLGIARHKVEDHYRTQLRAPLSVEEGPEDADEWSVIPDWDQKLDEERIRKRTLRVLKDLPEPYRLALLWRYWEKCPAHEMAARTGKTEKSIERLLARARGQFRRMWQDA